MRAKPKKQPLGTFLYPDLLDQLDPKHSLLQLAGFADTD
jgi:IS5 family transposase